MQPRVAQALRVGGEQRAVGGQRDVGDARCRCDEGHQDVEVATEQRLTAREPDLADAEVGEDPYQPPELFVGQQLAARQERVAGAKDLARHAVAAAEVAAVGDRYPQVAQWSGAAVADRRRDRVPSRVPRWLRHGTSVGLDPRVSRTPMEADVGGAS